MSSALADRGAATRPSDPATGRTIGSSWRAVAGRAADDALLLWPPDMFAFTDVILRRAEAYRFTVSAPPGRTWPPNGAQRWREEVPQVARAWCRRLEAGSDDLPARLAQEWEVVRHALDTPLREVASGRAWRLCEALLTLHAVADEACAGVAAGTEAPADRIVLRARMSELLARTGSLARLDPACVRVLPKYRTPYGGITFRSISRYLSLSGPAVDYTVNKVSSARGKPAPEELNVLLLPWPLRVSAADFRPVRGSIQERALEPFGFFEFQASEPFDVSLVDRLLASAAEHVEKVDAVVLPESSVPRGRVADLEAVLSRNGVPLLIAGVSDEPSAGARFGSNWVHFGAAVDGQWWHYRQDKHHRWSLDRSQIEQYHLEHVLDPRVRWWEAVEINYRSLQMIERDDGQTIAALVCEDLAQMDEVVDLLRAVGPTLVVALLLDGPQLESRWTARYASVLADDPGSAVLTLTSYGMVANARGPAHPRSSVVALWKDNARGIREISLNADAQGILLGLHRLSAIRRAADGRSPEQNASDLRIANITQLRAAQHVDHRPVSPQLARPSLSPTEHSVLTAWSEAVSRAETGNPAVAEKVLADARAGARWRAQLDLPQPTGALSDALDQLTTRTQTAGRRR